MSEGLTSDTGISDPGTSGGQAFGLRTVLALVIGGALLFVALLWMIGAGVGDNNGNNGGAHVGGRGLNGYAGLAQYLEGRGFTVRRSQGKAALAEPGLLVLTPPPEADGKAIDRIVAARRYTGPTMVILPKWRAYPVSADASAKAGWVRLEGTGTPEWRGFLDGVTVAIAPAPGPWRGVGLSGRLPEPQTVLGAGTANLVALVRASDGRPIAGYIPDRGYYPALAAAAGVPAIDDEDDEYAEEDESQSRVDRGKFPLVLVIEPDLLDNYGLRDQANAVLAERLVRLAGGDALTKVEGEAGGKETGGGVTFDMTLNGFTRSPNLLTLAFTPPFLAATLCLLLAAVAAGWRAFVRFGPPRRQDRAIAFGKRALVANTAGLIGRSGRLHLLAAPYVARSRDRLVRALGLPRGHGTAETDAAIDRALARRRRSVAEASEAGEQPPFSLLVARLGSARRPQDVLSAAAALHTLERTLTR